MGTTKGGTRRKHSDDFRAEVLAQCRQSGKSIAGVALKHGLNANMVRVWLRKSEPSPICHSLVDPAASSATLASQPQQFVSVRMDVPSVAPFPQATWDAGKAKWSLGFLSTNPFEYLGR